MLAILNGILPFGVLPESATVLVFGVFMVASTIGLRRIFKSQKQTDGEEITKESFKN